MKRIVLPPLPAETPVPFYLSVEEWVAANLPEDEYFFAWQVNPTVICGRHQDIPSEVDLAYAESHGIFVCRRKSGGGAVYADRQNVMFSYITPSDAVQTTFSKYTGMVCDMLASLGIDASPSGRNDITVNGRKVAGNAFLKLPHRSIVHGTMLCDADFDTVSRVLTPSRAKILSNGVVSVPSRITTLRSEGLNMDCEDFMKYAVEHLCKAGEYTLNKHDLEEVREIAKTYHTNILDISNTRHSHPVYLDGVGQMSLRFATDNAGLISAVDINGDFFPLKDFQSMLTARLVGKPLRRQEMLDALADLDYERFILGLTAKKFESLLPNN